MKAFLLSLGLLMAAGTLAGQSRMRDYGIEYRTAQRDHGREGRPGRRRHADRRRLGTHGRHGRHSPSRQYFPAQAAGSRLHRQRLRQNGRLHADQGIGKPRNPDRADQHARRGGRSGRADRLHALESRERRRQVGQRGGGRDQRRNAERHSRTASPKNMCSRLCATPRKAP